MVPRMRSGGKTLVNATSYDIKQGKTIIGGTVKNILFEPNFANPTISTLSSIYLNQTPVFASGYYYAATWGFTTDGTSGYYSGTSLTGMASRSGILGPRNAFNLVNNKLLTFRSRYQNYSDNIYIGTPGSAAPTFSQITGANNRTYNAYPSTNSIVYYGGKYNGIIIDNQSRSSIYPYIYDPSANTLTVGSTRIGSFTYGYPDAVSLLQGSNIYVLATSYGSDFDTYIRTHPLSGDFNSSWTAVQTFSGGSGRVFLINNKYYLFTNREQNVYMYTSSDGSTWSSATTLNNTFSFLNSRCGFGYDDGKFFAAKWNDSTKKIDVLYSKDLTTFTKYSYDVSFSSGGAYDVGDILKDNSGYYFAIYWAGSATRTNSVIVHF